MHEETAFRAPQGLLFPNPAVTGIAVFALLFAAAATGWNIFSGYTGYIALGHAAYFGLGAYALAIMWDLLPSEEQRDEAGRRLADLVRESGYRISTGFQVW